MGKYQPIQQPARGMDPDHQQVRFHLVQSMQNGGHNFSNFHAHREVETFARTAGEFFQPQFNCALGGGFVGDRFQLLRIRDVQQR